jgi:hypothetical protein
MDRNTAHWHWSAQMLATRRERDIKRGRSGNGIIEEKLKKIAHPIKQQTISRLSLQIEILRHHWRGRGGMVSHQQSDSEFAQANKAIFPSGQSMPKVNRQVGVAGNPK